MKVGLELKVFGLKAGANGDGRTQRHFAVVVTYADHEVITPAHPLNKAIASASQEDDDPVARAEAALAQLSEQFAEWMQAECERLERARQDVLRQGVTQTTHGELSRATPSICVVIAAG